MSLMHLMVLVYPPAFARCIWPFRVVSAVGRISLDPDEWVRQYLDWKAGILRTAVPLGHEVSSIANPTKLCIELGSFPTCSGNVKPA